MVPSKGTASDRASGLFVLLSGTPGAMLTSQFVDP